MLFLIKQGNHYSNKWWLPIIKTKKTLFGKAIFIGDFKYDIGKKQKDSNKLIGISDGLFHHRNSIRIGWFWNDVINKITIVGICYSKGKRTIKSITNVNANKEYSFVVFFDKRNYVVSFNNKHTSFPRTKKTFFFGFLLKPYFGGVTKAPKDFKFRIETY